MQHKLISGDNHIDLTYCPADLWSAQAPAKRGEERAARRRVHRLIALAWFIDGCRRELDGQPKCAALN